MIVSYTLSYFEMRALKSCQGGLLRAASMREFVRACVVVGGGPRQAPLGAGAASKLPRTSPPPPPPHPHPTPPHTHANVPPPHTHANVPPPHTHTDPPPARAPCPALCSLGCTSSSAGSSAPAPALAAGGWWGGWVGGCALVGMGAGTRGGRRGWGRACERWRGEPEPPRTHARARKHVQGARLHVVADGLYEQVLPLAVEALAQEVAALLCAIGGVEHSHLGLVCEGRGGRGGGGGGGRGGRWARGCRGGADQRGALLGAGWRRTLAPGASPSPPVSPVPSQASMSSSAASRACWRTRAPTALRGSKNSASWGV